MATVTVKDELHQLIDNLDEQTAEEALDYLRWLISDDEEELTDEEYARVLAGEAAIARGEYVTLDELKRSLNL